MAYISKVNIVKEWERCDISGCCHRSYYLKDEAIALCKEHRMSKIDRILNKKVKSEQDKEYLFQYIKQLNQILKKFTFAINKIIGK